MVVRVHWHSVPLLVPNISLLVPIAVNYIPSFVGLQLPKMIQIISMEVEKTVYSPLPWSKTEGEGDWVRETVRLACDWHCLVMSHCDICRDFERNIRNDNKVANFKAHLC